MKNNYSLISVVVAAYNESKYLADAINSILAQENVKFEVIFVDDGSTDDTFKISQEIASKDYRIKVYKNPKKGKCSAFNFGVQMAEGAYVCIFAGDDIMPVDSLAKRYHKIKDFNNEIPTVGLSKLVTMSDMPKFNGHLVPKAAGRGGLSGVSPLMNRLALNFIFPVPEDLPNEDTWMELAMLHMDEWRLIHSDIICCKWRVHSGNSLNMTLPYQEYNQRMTKRFSAYSRFFDQYHLIMSPLQREQLAGKVLCEDRRKAGDWLGVIRAPVGLKDRLRALSLINSFMYGIRRGLYGLLTGW
jgi:hypothetical protein